MGYYLGAEDIETGEVEITASVSDAVCIKLDGSELVEEGDDGLGFEEYMARSSLIVDGSRWTSSAPELLVDELASVRGAEQTINIETGEITGEELWNAGGPFTICWPVKLDKGLHRIEFQSRTTSGKLFSFEWQFEIGG